MATHKTRRTYTSGSNFHVIRVSRFEGANFVSYCEFDQSLFDISPRSAASRRPCSKCLILAEPLSRALSISSNVQDLLWRIHPFAGLRKTKRCMFLQRQVIAMRRKQTISGFVSKRASCQHESRLIVIVDIAWKQKKLVSIVVVASWQFSIDFDHARGRASASSHITS